MPIHDQSYRRYAGQRAALGRSWTVIARAGIMNMLRKRLFILLLIAGWVPFLVYAVLVYFSVYYPQTAQWFTPDAKMFRGFFERQEFFVFVLTIYVGAGLIANDRRANALQIYLSKPLMRSEYIAGKAAILFTFLMLVTWVPGILLVLLQIMFSGTFAFVKANLFLFPAITVAAILQAVLSTFTMLALSSLSKSSRYVGILYAAVIFFTQAIYGVVYVVTRSTAMSWISVSANLTQLGDLIFRLPPKYDTPWIVSLFVVVGLVAASGLILERRVRGVEVVA